jgi:hypothetical protein
MPADFAYMTSAKNLKSILEKLRGAGTPPKFSLQFLKELGFPSSRDRPVIGVLKGLGFLTPDGTPTERYNAYRDATRSGRAIAEGLREGWGSLFLVDQTAHTKTSAQLTELFKSVSGKGEASAQKMATTFKILADLGDWAETPPKVVHDTTKDKEADTVEVESGRTSRPSNRSLTLHHDIHLHLPATSDTAVYLAIFKALKAELLD